MSRVTLTFSLVIVFLFSISLSSFSQSRNCSSQELHEQNMLNPTYAKEYNDKIQKAYKIDLNAAKVLCSNPVLLPVAVHFQGISNPDMNCLRALAQDQINILNADFQGSNADISNWAGVASNYPGTDFSETCVEFSLADQNHPASSGLVNGDLAVTFNQSTGSSDSDWNGYLNIFVRSIGALGFSPLGGNGNGDGVTVDIEAFGSGAGCTGVVPDPPFNLGRTATHEVGHYLLLGHIWGNGCNVDDGIADTPDQASSNGGCPSANTTSCGSIDLHMNYMDYTNDACMYMFSEGQGTVMENYVTSDLDNLVDNAFVVCSILGPNCVDLILNGNEVGVDCGGPDCDACAVCSSQGNNTSDEWIESVVIGSYTNVSGDNGGYADFTGTPFDVYQNTTTNFTLTPEWDGQTFPEYFRIWADLNGDYDFDDAGEMLFDQGSANSNASQTGSFVIPSSSNLGQVTLRVSMKWNGAPGQCETFTYGEVEDYTININTAPPVPANDLCANQQLITPGNYAGTTNFATTTDNPPGCNQVAIEGPAVWYTFASSGTGETVVLDVCGASFDTRMHLFDGSCTSLNCLASDDNTCGDDAQISFVTPTSFASTVYYVAVSGTGGTSGDFVLSLSSSALDIELISFKGEALEKGNQISWTTASESRLSKFEIQRSANLVSWETIEEVNPRGTESEGANYQIVDKDFFANSYYRLLSRNMDESFDLSEFVQLKRADDRLKIELYPNPATDFVNMDISSPANSSGVLEVRDLSGKIIHVQDLNIINGRQQQQLNMKDWVAGVYFLRWNFNGQITNNRVVKK